MPRTSHGRTAPRSRNSAITSTLPELSSRPNAAAATAMPAWRSTHSAGLSETSAASSFPASFASAPALPCSAFCAMPTADSVTLFGTPQACPRFRRKQPRTSTSAEPTRVYAEILSSRVCLSLLPNTPKAPRRTTSSPMPRAARPPSIASRLTSADGPRPGVGAASGPVPPLAALRRRRRRRCPSRSRRSRRGRPPRTPRVASKPSGSAAVTRTWRASAAASSLKSEVRASGS